MTAAADTATALPDALGPAAREFLARPQQLLIGEERLDAADGATFVTLDPSSGREIATVAQAGAEDVERAVRAAREALDRHQDASVLIFESGSSAPVDIDLRGSVDDVLARIPPATTARADEDAAVAVPRGPGRPKLGVVAREITLLPRHWEWLARQSGGASVAIRKLVDDARRGGEDKDRIREGQDAAYRFMSAMAGNKPHFEEAIRALFAPNPSRFQELIAGWPADVRDHAARLAERAFPGQKQP